MRKEIEGLLPLLVFQDAEAVRALAQLDVFLTAQDARIAVLEQQSIDVLAHLRDMQENSMKVAQMLSQTVRLAQSIALGRDLPEGDGPPPGRKSN